MTQAAFRLESFSDRFPAVRQATQERALDEAYQKGVADGRDEAETRALDALTDALMGLRSSLDDHHALRRQVAQQTVAELTPILQAITRSLAQRGRSAGLESALQAELVRLAQDMTDPDWHIDCPPEMEPMIRHCASVAGLTDVDIRSRPDATAAVVVMDDGRSLFSTDGMADHICSLISELQESYR